MVYYMGLIFAEGFGFVWDDTGQMGNSSPFDFIYDWTYANIHVPGALADLLAMGGLHVPFHRATPQAEDCRNMLFYLFMSEFFTYLSDYSLVFTPFGSHMAQQQHSSKRAHGY